MSETKKNFLINAVFCLVFAISARIIYTFKDSETRLIELIPLMFLVCLFTFCSLIFLNNILNSKILGKILNILFIPFSIVFFLNELISFCLPVVVFLMLYFLPTMIFGEISEFYNINPANYDGVLYLINIVTVLLYAYFGDSIMNRLFIFLNVKSFKDKIVNEFMTKKMIRVYTYIIMIAIYIMYNFHVFNGLSNILGYSIDSFNIIKEVFVTFVAVDTVIQIIRTSENRDLNKKSEKGD